MIDHLSLTNRSSILSGFMEYVDNRQITPPMLLTKTSQMTCPTAPIVMRQLIWHLYSAQVYGIFQIMIFTLAAGMDGHACQDRHEEMSRLHVDWRVRLKQHACIDTGNLQQDRWRQKPSPCQDSAMFPQRKTLSNLFHTCSRQLSIFRRPGSRIGVNVNNQALVTSIYIEYSFYINYQRNILHSLNSYIAHR